jgi:hypothetical protein
MITINWIETTDENLMRAYTEYVEQVENDKSLMIVTSVLGLMPYKNPKTGVPKNTIFIKHKYKVMTSVLKIFWNEDISTPEVCFAFMNGEPDKFFRIEDIEL